MAQTQTVRERGLSRGWLGLAVGLALLAAIVGGQIALRSSGDRKVVLGAHDEIYYYRRATKEDALALGQALQSIGFLNDRGTSVLLNRGAGEPATISFVVSDGAWNRPNAVSDFTEIGRRVAHAAGGFPIAVHLIDAHRVIRRKMTVGKAILNGQDAVYYFGDTTAAEARALGQALQSAGYFTGHGITAALTKGQGTVISLVVQEGFWDRADVIATLERLVRDVAGAVGGLPVELRLLNREMDVKRQVEVR